MCLRHPTFFQNYIVPYVVHSGCSMAAFSLMRARIIPQARGVVAEVGFGSGLNMPFYDVRNVERIIGVDPDTAMLDIARKRIEVHPLRLELVQAKAEEMPLAEASIDTIVITYALCTIPDPKAALAEVRRVLKPDGRLLFIEHERFEGSWRGRWQDRLDGVWGRIAGGCHLTRSPVRLIEEAGFAIAARQQERFPLHLWQLGTQSAGVALPA